MHALEFQLKTGKWCVGLGFKPPQMCQTQDVISLGIDGLGEQKQGCGQLSRLCGRKCYSAEPDQWLILKPGRRIQTFSPDARMISIAFDARVGD